MEWLPDEHGLSGVHSLSADEVVDYEARHSFDPSAEVGLLRRLGLSADDVLVEFGPGPGAFTLAAARHAAEVIAVDPSPAMCSHLSRRAEESDSDNIRVVNAGFLTYRHQGPPVPYVFTKNALHHLPDFWKAEALCRIHDLLEPGGILRLRDLVYSFAPASSSGVIGSWVEEAEERGWSRAERIAHIRSEFSTYTWLLEPMLTRVGFEILDRFESDSGIFAHYTCRRP